MNRSNHTPEGVRDIYNGAMRRQQVVCEKINKTIGTYGYSPIKTPTFEYFDVFGKEVGTIPSCDLYKFFDREGNTLVLRPDITPSIGRAAAMYFNEEKNPVRLCYDGNIFINNHSYQGRLKETTQIGAELIMDPSIEADAEMLSMVVETLKSAGLSKFQISVGHAGFFKGLVSACGFNEDEVYELSTLILNKNFFGVEEFLTERNIEEDLIKLFSMMGSMYSSTEDWAELTSIINSYEKIKEANDWLNQLNDLLFEYNVSEYVSFELGLISPHEYYTGIIFSGYTYGSGEPIVSGGRYDQLLSYYGFDAAAIGFAITVDQLMLALERQNIEVLVDDEVITIAYNKANVNEKIKEAMKLRASGKKVVLTLGE